MSMQGGNGRGVVAVVGAFLVTSLSVFAGAPIPGNDTCGNALPIADGTVAGSLFNASSGGDASCESVSGADVWYSYTAPCNGTLYANTCSTFATYGVDTILSVYAGCPGDVTSEIACNDDAPAGTGRDQCDAFGPVYDSAVSISVQTGDTVLIRVAKNSTSAPGDFYLSVSCVETGPVFRRGDCNADGQFDVVDTMAVVGVLFLEEPMLCASACDANGDGVLHIADAAYVLNSIFLGAVMPAPFPNCDVDPSPGNLGCVAYASCP